MKARVALLIGNTRYEDSRLSRLKAPAGDVEALATVLRKPTLGGFEVQTVVDTTTADVMRAIALFFKGRAADDLLLLYFSGHGLLDESRRLYFANSNTDTDLLTGTAVPASFVREEMDRSRAKSQVLILDCCHGGAFSGGKGAVGESIGTDLIFGAEGSGRVVLTATNATQYAFEGERLLGIPNRSVFTHYLIEGLQSGDADLDGDGKITVDELYTYVWGKIRDATPAQSPMKWTYGATGQIVLAQGLSTRPRPDLIPAEVSEDISSPHIHRRRAALTALNELAISSPPGAAAAAREMLKQMARQDDSFTIRREAENALAGLPRALAVVEPDPQVRLKSTFVPPAPPVAPVRPPPLPLDSRRSSPGGEPLTTTVTPSSQIPAILLSPRAPIRTDLLTERLGGAFRKSSRPFVIGIGLGLAMFVTTVALVVLRRSSQDVLPTTLATVPAASIGQPKAKEETSNKPVLPPVLVPLSVPQESKAEQVAPVAQPAKDELPRPKTAVHASTKPNVIPAQANAIGSSDGETVRPKLSPAKGSLDDLIAGALARTKTKTKTKTIDIDENVDSPKKAGDESTDVAGPLPKSEVVAGMNRVKGKIAECFTQYMVPGMAMVNVVIGRSGRVTSAVVVGKFAGTPTGKCVEQAVKTASFPPSLGLTTPYPFQLR